jgi:hypothetical protein
MQDPVQYQAGITGVPGMTIADAIVIVGGTKVLIRFVIIAAAYVFLCVLLFRRGME